MDILQITGLRASTYLGVYSWEQELEQDVLIDLAWHIDAKAIARNDDISDTVDYSVLNTKLCQFLAEHRFKLLETMAQQIADFLLAEFGMPWLKLNVTKLGSMKNAKQVTVILERSK